MKYTKGPWNPIKVIKTIFITSKIYNNKVPIAEITQLKNHDETIGNINLISAAPELFESLQDMCGELGKALDTTEFVRQLHDKTTVLWQARQAIKKAKGEP